MSPYERVRIRHLTLALPIHSTDHRGAIHTRFLTRTHICISYTYITPYNTYIYVLPNIYIYTYIDYLPIFIYLYLPMLLTYYLPYISYYWLFDHQVIWSGPLWVDEDARRADFGPVWAVIMAFFQRTRYVTIYILYIYIHMIYYIYTNALICIYIYIYTYIHTFIYINDYNLYINTFDKWWILHIYWCLFFCRLHIRTVSGSAPLPKKWESPLCNYACWFFKTQLTIQLLIPLYHVISCYIPLITPFS